LLGYLALRLDGIVVEHRATSKESNVYESWVTCHMPKSLVTGVLYKVTPRGVVAS